MSEHDRRAELRLFLKERRARVNPAEAGIPVTSRRRVRGLRREEVASLAGIGVSWYTALENGDAQGVSEATLLAVAQALRLSDSERHYLMALTGRTAVLDASPEPAPLVLAALQAMAFPAYLITPDWDVLACNEPFRRVWAIDAGEMPFNAVARLFLDPRARAMHGESFEKNMTPVIAMLRSSHGRQPTSQALLSLRESLMKDDIARRLWDAFDIVSPLLSNACSVASPLGMFRYETLTLPIPGHSHGLVVQVPDDESRRLFA